MSLTNVNWMMNNGSTNNNVVCIYTQLYSIVNIMFNLNSGTSCMDGLLNHLSA